VKAFNEKPDPVMARELISQGGLWNTLVMVFQLKRMLGLLEEMSPKDSLKLFEMRNCAVEAPGLYRDISPWNFSSHILVRIAEELIVLEVPDIRWSDWGTRESIERTYRDMNLMPAWRPRIAIPSLEPLMLKQKAG
jgi:mannose-1-phosphate guanylyltransferase